MLGTDVVHNNFPRLGRLLLALALASGAAPAAPLPGGGGSSSLGSPPPDTRRGGDGVGGIEKNAGQSSGGTAGGKGAPTTGSGPSLGAAELPGTDLGGALAGSDTPVLAASGGTAAGQTLGLQASHALPLAPAALVLGASELDAPFKGGTLVPAPGLLLAGLVMDANGELTLQSPVPDAVPAGFELFVQLWTVDPLGPRGFAATNALEIGFP